MRKRRDQQLEAEGPPADRGAEVPEIDLAGAGRPLELEVPLSARRRPGEPELANEPLHGGVRAAVAALGDEPIVDPPGGVALLPRGPEVGLEDARDPFLVALERGRAPGPRGAALLLKLLNFSCSRCLFPSEHSDHFLVNINIQGRLRRDRREPLERRARGCG